MSSYIQNYYRKLDDLRLIGASNEGSLRCAFERLLENIGEEYHLTLHNEYSFKTKDGANRRADGVLVDKLKIVHGWWEAKDSDDNLQKEIEIKLKQGYPSDNIIFEDTQTAILLQNGSQTMQCCIYESSQLEKLLTRFFNYELPEVSNFKRAKEKFLIELPSVSKALIELLKTAHVENKNFQHRAELFLALCHRSINERVTEKHIDEMLIQHILTDQIFRAVFPDSRFHSENHLAIAINELEQCFFKGETRMLLLKRLEPYFAVIRQAAASEINQTRKQDFLKDIYEDFYSAYNPNDADKLGVVYTPKEAVRFMIEGADFLAQKHFNKRLADNGLDILDPCMGTGTFIVDLLDYWRGDIHALNNKFQNEIHANEISILPYYIACLNIEQSFYEITGKWVEFKGACFVNTLANWGFKQTHSGANKDIFGSITDENHTRIIKQNDKTIPIILGNPPYNANQKNENDNNKNDVEPQVDKRIKETYLNLSTAQKTKLYDPYIRFFRWASDRLGEQGIIAFITNRSYLDSRQADGFRQTIANEFQEILIIDLMSDVRKNPKISGTKHNIFGIQAGVAIVFLVRNPELVGCDIHYLSLNDFLLATEKRDWLKHNSLRKLIKAGQLKGITPNKKGDWLNQATEFKDWASWTPVASKEAKLSKKDAEVIFKLYSLGVATNRDDWVYGLTEESVSQKVNYLIDCYEAKRVNSEINDGGIKWTRAVRNDLAKDIEYKFDSDLIIDSLYRPFVIRKLYFSKQLNEMPSRQREIFNFNVENIAIGINGVTSNKSFESIAVTKIHDLHFYGDTITLPLYTYNKDGQHENISDWALKQFQGYYENPPQPPFNKVGSNSVSLEDVKSKGIPPFGKGGQGGISKRDIFNYVYAVLHDPRYRKKFELNLKAEFPRIPFHSDFKAWANIGEQLIHLHTNFENVEQYPLKREDLTGFKNLSGLKVKLKADKINHKIEIDTQTILSNIPAKAWEYKLGNRSALEWVLDQYKEKKPKDKTIANKFNTYRFEDYKEEVIVLLAKVCRVSIETVALIEQIELLESNNGD